MHLAQQHDIGPGQMIQCADIDLSRLAQDRQATPKRDGKNFLHAPV